MRRALLPTHMYHLSRRRAPPPALRCPGGCSATAQVVQSSPVQGACFSELGEPAAVPWQALRVCQIPLVSDGARCHIPALLAWENTPGCQKPSQSQGLLPGVHGAVRRVVQRHMCFGGLSVNQNKWSKIPPYYTVTKSPPYLCGIWDVDLVGPAAAKNQKKAAARAVC